MVSATKAWVLLCVLGAGCTAEDLCAGEAGTCLGIAVQGSIGALDTLHLNLTGAVVRARDASVPSGALPVNLAVLLPATAQGLVEVQIQGLRSGSAIAAGSGSAAITPLAHVNTVIQLTASAGPVSDLSSHQMDLLWMDQGQPVLTDLVAADLVPPPDLQASPADLETPPDLLSATWSSVASGTSNNLNGVWGSSATDVWAVGAAGTTLHWNGSAFSPVSSGTNSALLDVWGTATNSVWAVGSNGTIRAWEGAMWFSESSGSSATLYGIGGNAAYTWAVGANDTTLSEPAMEVVWSAYPTSGNLTHDGVWSSGPNDVWLVGSAGINAHWNGAQWATPVRPAVSNLYGVWGSAANDVWAVGYGGAIVHWNGAQWSIVTSGTNAELVAVWGSAANDVWAVGYGGVILHWNGSAWRSTASPTTMNLLGVWAASPTEAFAVGASGTLLHYHP